MDITNLDDLLNQAEAHEQNQNNWQMDLRYESKEFYIDEHGTVEIRNKTIGDMSKHISVKGESYSQYIEFKTNRFYDGVDLTKMLLSIYFEIPNVGSDENRPVNVYYNDNEIKFGWAIPDIVSQKSSTLNLCIYARGKLEDGKTYLLKTKTAKYTINEGLDIGSGIIEPTENWYLDFVLEMDEKVQIATDAAKEALSSKESAKQSETSVMQSKNEVNQKSSNVDSKHSEVVTMHRETKQFRDETEQFRNEAETFTPDGYATIVEQVNENTEGIQSGFKKQASGTDIHVTDAVDGKVVEFAMYGKSEQNTTSGNQLFDSSYRRSDGAIRCINGTVTEENGIFRLVANSEDSYIWRACSKESSYNSNEHGQLIEIPNDSDGLHMTISNENFKANYVSFYDENKVCLDVKGYSTNSFDFTPDIYNNAKYLTLRFGLGKTILSGTYETTVMINNVLTALPWEPYTGGIPSPNPEFPQEIETAGASGSVEVKSCGKNLLRNIVKSTTPNGGSVTVNADKSITINGTFTATTYLNLDYVENVNDSLTDLSNIIGKKLIASISNVEISGIWVTIGYFKKNGEKVSYANTFTKQEIVFPTEAYKGRNYVRIGAGTYNNVTVYPMLRLATDTDDTYEPYKETTSLITTPNGLPGIKVSSGGNYTDENGQQWITDEIKKFADGSGEYIQRIGKAVFDGSDDEKWGYGETSVSGKYRRTTTVISNLIKKSATNNTKANAICTNYQVKTPNSTYKCETCVSVATNGNIQVYDENNNANSTESWKEYLSQNPFTLYYELAEPIHTPLTSEQISEIDKLNTFKPITNISNNEQCGMSVTYATVKEALMLQEAYNQSKENAQEIGNVKEEIVDIKKELSDTTFKVNTIIEKADLGIKETSSGEYIHVTDSSNSKVREFALYGKAKQNTTSGKNLLKNTNISRTLNGVTFTVNDDESITVKGTATQNTAYILEKYDDLLKRLPTSGEVILSGCTDGSGTTYDLRVQLNVEGVGQAFACYNSPIKIVYNSLNEAYNYNAYINILSGVEIDTTFYPMVSVEGGEYEPFTNGASPNPQYPQPIEVSGESYNLLKNMATSQTINGVEFLVNENGSITANGTSTGDITLFVNSSVFDLENGVKYILTGCPIGGSTSGYRLQYWTERLNSVDTGNGVEFVFDNTVTNSNVAIRLYPNVNYSNVTFYPMIRKASVKNDRYMSYGVDRVEVKSIGKNLFAFGITAKDTTAEFRPNSSQQLKISKVDDGNFNRIKCNYRNGNYSYGYLSIEGIDGTKDYIIDYIVETNTTPYNVRMTKNSSRSNSERLVLSISGENGANDVSTTDYFILSNIQVTEEATPYEPYKETISTIPTENGLAGIKVSKNGNYTDQNGQQWVCDEIVKYADGSSAYIQRISKDVITGARTIHNVVDGNFGGKVIVINYDYCLQGVNKNRTMKMCDKLSYSGVREVFSYKDTKVGTWGFNSGGDSTSDLFFIFCIDDETVTTIDLAQQWLNNNPLTVYYIIAEPIHTPLTAEEIAEIENLQTFYPVTNISNDFDCGMKVKYNCDSKNYIDNKLAQIAAAVVNNI